MLDDGEGSVGPPALVQVATEAVVVANGAERVALLDEIDRLMRQLDRPRRCSRLAGELGCPGAQLGQVDAGELGRIGHGIPRRQGPLEVCERLRQAENCLRLPGRSDRSHEGFRRLARRRPVGSELRG